MAATDPKAQALSDARARILKLQEQMTDRVLQMAVEVEKLMGIVPPAEAKAFLKARCNLPAVELSTYVGFAKSLKGSQDILRDARRRSKGFTYAPVPKAAPTDAVNEGFVPGLTLRMRARLQDFPDWHFVEGFEKAAEQIGNAVAVRVSKAVGLATVAALKGLEMDWQNLIGPPQGTWRSYRKSTSDSRRPR